MGRFVPKARRGLVSHGKWWIRVRFLTKEFESLSYYIYWLNTLRGVRVTSPIRIAKYLLLRLVL